MAQVRAQDYHVCKKEKQEPVIVSPKRCIALQSISDFSIATRKKHLYFEQKR